MAEFTALYGLHHSWGGSLEVLSHLPARGFHLTRAEVLRRLEVAPGTHEPQRWRHNDVPEEDLPF